ncbi:MAG: MotA/TolQ/ExbB proton channel family protein [Paracoccaceae bacterium]
MSTVLDLARQIIDLGGPVILILFAASIYVLGAATYKLWQFQAAGVGRHKALRTALKAWDAGDRTAAKAELARSQSYLAPVVDMAFSGQADTADRLESEAEARFARLESGLRSFDTIAHLAPLLGLFGTVLGMIEAFQALQEAGSRVDPALLAGGIWVALTTTAAGLAVAMPTSLIHAWFEGRMERERGLADQAIQTALRPVSDPVNETTSAPAHA